jgi:homocysteine S-methyltransferase
MNYWALHERLARGDVLVLDGATGTELQRRGVPMHQQAWSATALLTHADTVRQLHADYIAAGADIIIADSFSTARHVLEPAGLGDRVAELNRAAMRLARQAADAADRPVWVAGSVSSFVPESDAGNTPSDAALEQSYREQAGLLAEAGADFLMLEMMRELGRACLAVRAAAATGLPVWVGFSTLPRRDGRTVRLRGPEDASGRLDADETVPTLAEAFGPIMAEGGVLAGIMHTEVEDTAVALDEVFRLWSGPVMAYPHSGGWANPNWQFSGVIPPAAFAAAAKGWVERGVQVVGGCCGIGPEHIRALARTLPKSLPLGARRAMVT